MTGLWDGGATGTVGITATVSEPYYDALQQGLIDNLPDVVGVGGRAFLVDTSSGQWTRSSVKVVEQRNVSSTRDLTLLPQGVWRHTVSSWNKGSGQSNMDRDESDINRYYRSINIDFSNQWQCSLLNQTNEVADIAESATAQTYLQEVNGDLFGAVGTKVFMITDFTNWTVSELTLPGSGVATGISTDGEYAIVSHGTDISRYENAAGVLTLVDTFNPSTHGTNNFVLWSQDRLLTNMDNVLWDTTPGASHTQIYQHPIPDFKWVAGTRAPNGTYLLGGNGDKWVIHFLQLDSTGATFDAPVVAQTLPDGEIGYSITSYQGFIIVGTRFGFRMMVADANGLLTSGAKVPTNTPVYDFEGQDRFVWYTQSSITDAYESPENEDTVSTYFPPTKAQGLGRMDLSEYTNVALTPAFANDLIAQETQFVWPTFTGSTPDSIDTAITAVATVDGINAQSTTVTGRRVFAQAGGKIYAEILETPAPGWLEQGRISYSVEDNKAGLYQLVKWFEPNDGGIFLDYKADGGNWYRSARVSMDSGISSGHRSTDGLVFSRLEPRYVIIPGTSNPAITRWELRSVPAVGKASSWNVPIMNYQELDIDGAKIIRDPVEELGFLMNLVQSGALFFYQESGLVYSVHATGFEWRPESLATGGLGWQGTFVLTVEEIV